jgi:iron complex outermembrane receptor protein
MITFFFAAAVALSGHVVDHDGHPVAGATVTLVEAKRAVRTDKDGAFTFADVSAGTVNIVARHLGYSPAAQRVEVTDGIQPITLTLDAAAFRAEPISVSATRAATETYLSPLPVSVLTGDRVHREAGMSLAKSVSALPGVRDVSTGLQIGKPVVRGLFGARVLTLHDGSRMEDYSWSEEDGPSIDARLAERVEVIRGPASVLYGSDALSGVVNVIPRELPYSSDPAFKYRGNIETYVQSNNLEMGGALLLEGTKGAVGFSLNGTGRFAQNYGVPGGEVKHTGFFSGNGDGAIAFRGAKHSATIRVSHYGGEFQLLEANGPTPGGADEGPERVLLDDRLQITGNHLFGKVRVETRAQYQRHELIEKGDECVPQPTCTPPPPGEEATTFDLMLNTASVDALMHVGSGAFTTTLGVSGMFQHNTSFGPIYLVPTATTTNAGAFALEELSFGKVKFMASGRMDARSLSSEANSQLAHSADDRSWSAPSMHGGIVVSAAPGLALTASVGTGWRAPTLFDLYANGPHFAENTYETGDPTLKPEKATDMDAGIRWSGKRIRVDASVFQNDIDDFMFLFNTGTQIGGLDAYDHVQADATFKGAEALLEVRVADPLTVRVQHDMVNGEKQGVSGAGRFLPFVPPARTVLGGELRGGGFGLGTRSTLGVELEHVAEQTRLATNDFATDGYDLVNIDFELERNIRGRTFRIDLDVRNATNTAYRDFMSRYKQFALSPGMNFVFRVATEF